MQLEAKQKQAQSQAADQVQESASAAGDANVLGSSRQDLAAKPSMMSVAESHINEENDEVKAGTGKAFGLSAFKATQSGLS